MSKSIDPPFFVQLAPSSALTRATIFVHVLAFIACFVNTLPISIKIVLLAGVCIHGCFALKQAASVRHVLRYSETTGWAIAETDEFVAIQMCDSTVVTTIAIWLHFKRHGNNDRLGIKRKQSILIPCDALSDDDYRNLVVKLKTTHRKIK